MTSGTRHWLMKSEPEVFSIEDLERRGRTQWDGVRNYQARNYMRDMQLEDRVLMYHSSTAEPGVVGLARVCRTAYPDHTQFDPKSEYYDAKATLEQPRWWMVDLAFEARFDAPVSLQALKQDPQLAPMRVVQKGSRLSVQPVEPSHFEHVVAMAKAQRQSATVRRP